MESSTALARNPMTAGPRGGVVNEIWLVRHGATEWTATHQHTGRTDLALTADGRREAAALVKPLNRQLFAAAFTSPLIRARGDRADLGLRRRRSARRPAGVGLRRLRRPDDRRDPAGDPRLERVEGPGDRGGVDRRCRRPGRGPFWCACATVEGRVVLFAHAHILRILTAVALGVAPTTGKVLGARLRLHLDPRRRTRLPRHPPLELAPELTLRSTERIGHILNVAGGPAPFQ